MRPSRVGQVLERLSETAWPVFIWGPPGVGKSSVVRQMAQRRGAPVVDIRAGLLDPTDLRGIPTVVDGRAYWCPPSFLPRPEDPPGLLFFDELNAAPPLVQASLYQLVLDRRVGEYQLPAGWWIVAAGNRAQDRSVAFRMPAALANRFVHVDYEVDFDDWRDWAIGNGIDPLIVAFLHLRRELLFDMRNPDRAFPTPRSWEIVSDTLRALGSHNEAADVLLGTVGEAAAIEFLQFAGDLQVSHRIEQIISDPVGAELPTEVGELYALVSMLISRAGEKHVRNAAAALLARLSPELAVMLVNDTLKVAPRFAAQSAVRTFMTEHGHLIAPR